MARSSTHHSHTRQCPWILVSFPTYCIHSFWLWNTDLPPVLLHMFELPFTHFLGRNGLPPHLTIHTSRVNVLFFLVRVKHHICTVLSSELATVVASSYDYAISCARSFFHSYTDLPRIRSWQVPFQEVQARTREPDHLLHVIWEPGRKQLNTSPG